MDTVAELSRDEILAILTREVELLAAEGETALAISSDAIARLKNFRGDTDFAHDEDRRSGQATKRTRDKLCAAENCIPPTPPFSLADGTKEERWNELRDIVLGCAECKKHLKPGKVIVFGAGNLNADIFFCGEAPGAEEEECGVPFVGRAGKLLDKVIEAMGLQRSNVYVGNIMNWRPEMDTPFGNRPPTQEEMNFCLPYLRAQVEIVSPKVIVALGATAANGLLGYDETRRMADVRGRWHEFLSIPLMVTYHPSYLLRNTSNGAKRLLWQDMLLVMERLSMEISERQRNFFL
ncbi:MAG: uracil-DNA glycosylase [Puniceicoccales bacterium]|jgi:DNA polymerase|nr:uracil-DNA glycosylase [Puniceicoccales bacterium]